jgi:hypothetical protein
MNLKSESFHIKMTGGNISDDAKQLIW